MSEESIGVDLKKIQYIRDFKNKKLLVTGKYRVLFGFLNLLGCKFFKNMHNPRVEDTLLTLTFFFY